MRFLGRKRGKIIARAETEPYSGLFAIAVKIGYLAMREGLRWRSGFLRCAARSVTSFGRNDGFLEGEKGK
jgi:hypothetical protein